MNYPKYEKIDEHTIRIIIEKGDNVPLSKLIENKKIIEEKIKQMQDTLNSINEILTEAEKMGITSEELKEGTKE